ASFIAKDPRFANPSRGNYALRPSSPCVNAGAMLDYTTESVDLALKPRVFNYGKKGAKPDMGCFESPWGAKGAMLLVK
ncbi:MAG: hypothetical protein MJ138_06370, partial [Kiritimatiellae bacterium]|nr:hypothetical protein [Kiritimatiellia bacterium]